MLEPRKAASFVVALNKAHVLALNTAPVSRLNKADVLALNKAHVLRLNSKICPVFKIQDFTFPTVSQFQKCKVPTQHNKLKNNQPSHTKHKFKHQTTILTHATQTKL